MAKVVPVSDKAVLNAPHPDVTVALTVPGVGAPPQGGNKMMFTLSRPISFTPKSAVPSHLNIAVGEAIVVNSVNVCQPCGPLCNVPMLENVAPPSVDA